MWSSSFVRLPKRHKFRATLVALALLVPASFAIARAEAPEPASPAAPRRPPQRPLGRRATETPKAPPAASAPETGEPACLLTPRRQTGEAPKKNLRIVYLGKEYPEPLPLSYAEKPITDKGIQGARLMLKEGNQAGNFVGHSFELIEAIVPEDGDVVAKAKEVLAAGERFIIADLEPADLLAVADLPEAKDADHHEYPLERHCAPAGAMPHQRLHVIPDYAMRADALAQYLDLEEVAALVRHPARYAGRTRTISRK